MPQAKYLRQINLMLQELWTWKELYARNASKTSNPYQAARFDERAAEINRAITQLAEVAEIIRELPRTSL